MGMFEESLDRIERGRKKGVAKIRTPLEKGMFSDSVDRATGRVPPIDVNIAQEQIDKAAMMDTEEGNWLVQRLNDLSRGNFAVANLGLEAHRGNVETWADFGKALKAGATLEKKTSWIDFMEEVVPGRHPWIEKGVGFAMDVVIDPINLVPIGWFGMIGDLLKLPKLMNMAGDIGTVSRVMEAVKPGWRLRKVPGAYDDYRKMQVHLNYIRRSVRRELTQRMDDFRKVAKDLGKDPKEALAELVRLREAGLADDVLPEFKPFYDDVVQGFEQLKAREIAAGILDPAKVKENYFPHIYERGKVVISGVDDTTRKAFEKGTLSVDELIAEGAKLSIKEHKGFSTKLAFRTPTPFMSKARKWESVDDAMQELLKMRKQGFAKDVAPIDDWFRGYAVRRFVGESAVAWKHFIDHSVKKFGTPFRDVVEKQLGMNYDDALKLIEKEGFEALDDLIPFKKGQVFVTPTTNLRSPAMQGELLKEAKRALMEGDDTTLLYKLFRKTDGSGLVELNLEQLAQMSRTGGKGVYLFPAEFAKEIKSSFKVFSSDESVKAFVGSMDKAMHMWKSMATSMRWPFHARNATSNTWLMYLADVPAYRIPDRIAEAAQIQLKGGKGIGGFASKEILDAADRYGVRAYGWIGADVPRMLQQELWIAANRGPWARALGVGKNAANPFENWSRIGRKVGTGIEDNSRLAVFVDQLHKLGLKKGMSAKQVDDIFSKASKHVKKYLFDYTELTEFERKVMKRIFPFYTWLRKNIPLQLESIVTKPHKYARLADFERAFWPDTAKPPIEKAIQPHWQKEAGWKRSDFQSRTGNPVYYKTDLPPDDLAKMWKVREFLGGAVNPVYAMTNIIQNVRTWPKGGKLAEPMQRTTAPKWIQWASEKTERGVAPFWVTWLSEPMKKLADIGPTFHRTKGMQVGMNPQWLYAMRTAFPFLGDWERAYPAAATEMVSKEKGKWARISYATGIKFRPLDLKEAALNKQYQVAETKRLLRRMVKWRGGEVGKEEVKKLLKMIEEGK